jgi:hypothetical protein
MLSSHTLDVVETFWAEFLGCKPQDFRGKGSRVVIALAVTLAVRLGSPITDP